MFGIGHLAELIVVLVIALLFFGPKRIPEIAFGLGKSIKEFRKATTEDDAIDGTRSVDALPMASAQRVAANETATAFATAAHHGD